MESILDEDVPVVDNGDSPQIEKGVFRPGDCSVGKMEDFDKRLAVLETKILIGGAIWTIIVLAWLGGMTTYLHNALVDLQALKQASKDHGIDIVSKIDSPTNPIEQRIALLTASLELRRAAQAKLAPDNQKLATLTHAVLIATKDGSNAPPEAWQAAAALISYRSDAYTGFGGKLDPECLLQNDSSAESVAGQPTQFRLIYTRCVFDMNDIAAFERQSSTRKMDEFDQGIPRVFHFIFSNAVVMYDPSRPAIPFASLTFINCRLEVKGDVTPLERQQPMLRAMLAEQGPQITLPGSLSPTS